jgi:hypothetical protein
MPAKPFLPASMTLARLSLIVAVAAIWLAVGRILIDHRHDLATIWRYETTYRTPEPMKWDDVIPANRNLNPRGQDR